MFGKYDNLKLFLLVSLISFILFVPFAWSEPHNIIFLIGDGMGFEQVKAAGIYKTGQKGSLSFESFPNKAEMSTYSANSGVTDSAASTTAMATGIKVNNGVISMAIPGDNSELYTLLEYFRDKGKRTGLVTTTFVTHATPATFGAHEPNRNNYTQIAQDYLYQTKPNVLFGGGANGMSVSGALAAGYTVITDRFGMQALNTENTAFVSGQFGTDHMPFEYDYYTAADNGYDSLPHLSAMTETALNILDNDPDGFFLMVEGGLIDHAGHYNDIYRTVFETIEFDKAVQKVMNWAQGRTDTIVLVTADHETGGLKVLKNNGKGFAPDVSWSTSGHTGVNVPVYAWGENAGLVYGVLDNTDLFALITSGTSPSSETCEAYCGTMSPGGCWCDDLCTGYGDCCPDYQEQCIGPPPSSETCEGYCGTVSKVGCWCDDLCTKYGDCCADYQEQCAGAPPPPAETCEGYCGGKSSYGCWCDDLCTGYGDCCPDYSQLCS